METGKDRTSSNDFEYVQDGETGVDSPVLKPTDNGVDQQQQQQSHRCNLLSDNDQQLENLTNSMKSTSIAVLEVPRSEYLTEIDAVKKENRVLLEKNNALMIRLETVEQKLKAMEVKTKKKPKVADLETKMLGKQKLTKSLPMSLSIPPPIPPSLRPPPIPFLPPFLPPPPPSSMWPSLYPPVPNGQNNLQEPRNLWSYNCWYSSDRVRLSADGLVATKSAENVKYVNIRAQQPMSLGMLAFLPAGGIKFAYYEVQLTPMMSNPFSYGWASFDSAADRRFVGNQQDSYAITWNGDLWECGRRVSGYACKFGFDDTLGSGIFVSRDGKLKLFFTQNGALNGNLIRLCGQDCLSDCQFLFEGCFSGSQLRSRPWEEAIRFQRYCQQGTTVRMKSNENLILRNVEIDFIIFFA